MLRYRLSGVIALLLVFILPSSAGFAVKPRNFNQAKENAFVLFSQHRETLYCQCRFNANKEVDLTSCNMHQAQPIARANRIEWEHMMPASHFGHDRACWQQSLCVNQKNGKTYRGRRCCERIDPDFSQQEAELYNLWPAVGLVNQMRSDLSYGYLDNKRGIYGCEFDADPDLKIAEPPDKAKGIVARANLFMSDHYHIKLSREQKALFEAWNHQFPPKAWEIEWAQQVAQIEGYQNPYIVKAHG